LVQAELTTYSFTYCFGKAHSKISKPHLCGFYAFVSQAALHSGRYSSGQGEKADLDWKIIELNGGAFQQALFHEFQEKYVRLC
jgi:hypothetical protein